MQRITPIIRLSLRLLKTGLCDCSDADILVKETVTVAVLAAGGNNSSIEVIFKKCAPFTDCISETSNAQLDNAKNIDLVMPMYNLIEYSNNLETFGSLWQYYRNEPS